MYKAWWSLTQDLSYNNFFLQLLLPVFKIADEKVLFMVNACVQIEQAENTVNADCAIVSHTSKYTKILNLMHWLYDCDYG